MAALVEAGVVLGATSSAASTHRDNGRIQLYQVGVTSRHLAALYGHVGVSRALLGAGADPQAPSSLGSSRCFGTPYPAVPLPRS